MTSRPITSHARGVLRRPRVGVLACCTALALVASAAPASGAGMTLRSGGTGPPGGLDPAVQVTQSSTGMVPRLADIVAQYPGWDTPIGTSKWVSVTPSRFAGSSTLRVTFTVPPNAVSGTLTGLMLADNSAVARVNGAVAGATPQSCTSPDAFRAPADPFSAPVSPGLNTLTFDVRNCDGPTGLDFEATVSYKLVEPVPAGVDNFKCYSLKRQAAPARSVTLRDQFGTTRARASEPRELCNPARVAAEGTSAGVRHPEAHLVCYRTTDIPSTITNHDVRLRNRFGTVVTTTLGAQRLCVPSLKRISKGKPVPPSGSNPEKVLDHYRCYDVEKRPRSLAVQLSDQFTDRSAKMSQLVRLCTPVRKTYHGKVVKFARPLAHLACYAISEGSALLQRDVIIRNQFGFGPLRTVKTEMLCVPTFKEVLH